MSDCTNIHITIIRYAKMCETMMCLYWLTALELVGPTYRTFITVMTCLFYTMGMLLLAGIAYIVRDWVYLCYATTLPFLLFFFYIM